LREYVAVRVNAYREPEVLRAGAVAALAMITVGYQFGQSGQRQTLVMLR